MTYPARAVLASVAAALLVGVLAGAVAAKEPGVSLNVANGECLNGNSPATLADGTTPCGAAIAGTQGFSGRLFGSGSVQLSALVCVHMPGDGSLSSYGGTYSLSVGADGTTQSVLASENVVGGQSCEKGAPTVSGSPLQITFPASGTLGYSLSVSGVDPASAGSAFRAFDRMVVQVYVSQAGQTTTANSPTVVPPGPPSEIPESPAVPGLAISAGLVTILILRRRMRAAGEAVS